MSRTVTTIDGDDVHQFRKQYVSGINYVPGIAGSSPATTDSPSSASQEHSPASGSAPSKTLPLTSKTSSVPKSKNKRSVKQENEKKDRKARFDSSDSLKESFIKKRWSEDWKEKYKTYLKTTRGTAAFWNCFTAEFNIENNTNLDQETCANLEKNLHTKWRLDLKNTNKTGNQDAEEIANQPRYMTLLADAFEVSAI